MKIIFSYIKKKSKATPIYATSNIIDVWRIYPFHISPPQISTPYPRFKYKPQDIRDDIFIGFTSRYFKYWKKPPARNRKEFQIHILVASTIKEHACHQKNLSWWGFFFFS